jgi:uncharacterized membrane-anchored protein YhcB (DUF1043 family)
MPRFIFVIGRFIIGVFEFIGNTLARLTRHKVDSAQDLLDELDKLDDQLKKK